MALNLRKKAEENKKAAENPEKREERAKRAVNMVVEQNPHLKQELNRYLIMLADEGKSARDQLRVIMSFIRLSPEKREQILSNEKIISKPQTVAKKHEYLGKNVDEVIRKDLEKLSPAERQSLEAQLTERFAGMRKLGREPDQHMVKTATLHLLLKLEREKLRKERGI
jgi:hypothetical protein